MKILGKNLKTENKLEVSRLIKKAMSRLLPICFVSVFISLLVCSVANDMYAFVKKDQDVNISIYDNLSLNEISDILSNSGIINNPDVFKLYVRFKNKTYVFEGFTGEATLNSSMSYRQIISEFSLNN